MKAKIYFSMFLTLVLSVTTLTAQSNAKIEVNSTEVSAMLKKNSKLIVLDVRTVDEFNEGHIKGAVNMDVRQSDFQTKVNKLDKNAKYIVHCRTNHRSTMAVEMMVKSGFKTIYQMMDGFSGWSANGLPVTK